MSRDKRLLFHSLQASIVAYHCCLVQMSNVIGPILFLVYINDLEEGVTGKILKFADDTKLFTKTKEIGDNKIYKMTLIN